MTGTVSGETVELEFFGVHSCGENPEGQVPLGVFSKEVEPGSNGFSAELTANVPGGLAGITATSTRATGATTEFSDCTDYAGTPRTFVVRSLGDNRTGEACEAGESTCTLRGAIEAADESEALDTIDFGVAGVIHVEGEPLPAISAPVHIDGASAPGYAGEPVVAIDGTGAEEEGPVYGLDVVEGAAVIQALAIGGFREGGQLGRGRAPRWRRVAALLELDRHRPGRREPAQRDRGRNRSRIGREHDRRQLRWRRLQLHLRQRWLGRQGLRRRNPGRLRQHRDLARAAPRTATGSAASLSAPPPDGR